jgi:hypothetical protein
MAGVVWPNHHEVTDGKDTAASSATESLKNFRKGTGASSATEGIQY